MIYAKLFWILFSFVISWSIVLSAEWKASEKIKPLDYPIIIGCINQITWEIKKPLNQTYAACYHWSKGWKNLRFPSKTQLKTMNEVFKSRASIITAMTLINHESQFDSKAKWCHKWWCDYGLFQIRDVNWWKKMSDKQQMEWFKKRKAWQLSSKWNCYQRVLQGSHEKVLRCVFARHHWDLKWTAKYPTDRLAEWKFYSSLIF